MLLKGFRDKKRGRDNKRIIKHIAMLRGGTKMQKNNHMENEISVSHTTTDYKPQMSFGKKALVTGGLLAAYILGSGSAGAAEIGGNKGSTTPNTEPAPVVTHAEVESASYTQPLEPIGVRAPERTYQEIPSLQEMIVKYEAADENGRWTWGRAERGTHEQAVRAALGYAAEDKIGPVDSQAFRWITKPFVKKYEAQDVKRLIAYKTLQHIMEEAGEDLQEGRDISEDEGMRKAYAKAMDLYTQSGGQETSEMISYARQFSLPQIARGTERAESAEEINAMGRVGCALFDLHPNASLKKVYAKHKTSEDLLSKKSYEDVLAELQANGVMKKVASAEGEEYVPGEGTFGEDLGTFDRSYATDSDSAALDAERDALDRAMDRRVAADLQKIDEKIKKLDERIASAHEKYVASSTEGNHRAMEAYADDEGDLLEDQMAYLRRMEDLNTVSVQYIDEMEEVRSKMYEAEGREEMAEVEQGIARSQSAVEKSMEHGYSRWDDGHRRQAIEDIIEARFNPHMMAETPKMGDVLKRRASQAKQLGSAKEDYLTQRYRLDEKFNELLQDVNEGLAMPADDSSRNSALQGSLGDLYDLVGTMLEVDAQYPAQARFAGQLRKLYGIEKDLYDALGKHYVEVETMDRTARDMLTDMNIESTLYDPRQTKGSLFVDTMLAHGGWFPTVYIVPALVRTFADPETPGYWKKADLEEMVLHLDQFEKAMMVMERDFGDKVFVQYVNNGEGIVFADGDTKFATIGNKVYALGEGEVLQTNCDSNGRLASMSKQEAKRLMLTAMVRDPRIAKRVIDGMRRGNSYESDGNADFITLGDVQIDGKDVVEKGMNSAANRALLKTFMTQAYNALVVYMHTQGGSSNDGGNGGNNGNGSTGNTGHGGAGGPVINPGNQPGLGGLGGHGGMGGPLIW